VRRPGPGRAGSVRTGILLCTLALSWLPGSQATTLDEAVRTALREHPRIKGAAAEQRATDREIRKARSGYFPSLDLRAAFGSEHTNIDQLHRSGNALGTLGKREASLVARQLLWDGMATRNQVMRSEALKEAATGNLLDTREAVAFEAVQAYLDVLRNQRLVELAEENVIRHRNILEDVRKRVRGGIGHKADLQQARGRLALAQSTLRARRGSLLQAQSAYERVVGTPPADLLQIAHEETGSLTSDGEIDPQRLQARIDRELAEAMERHPAIIGAEARLRAAEAELKLARSAYHPRITLEAAMTRDRGVSGVEGIRNTESLMLVTNWNLFRGGADRANEQAVSERRIRALEEAADIRRKVRENVQIAVEAKATSEARLGYLREHVSASEETLQAYKAQFNLGRRTLLDVLNAEIELFNARSNLVVGEFDDILNGYYIQASKGALTRSFRLAGE